MLANTINKFANKSIAFLFEILAVFFLLGRMGKTLFSSTENTVLKIVILFGIFALFSAIILLWDKIDKIISFLKECITNLSVKRMIICIVLIGLITKFFFLFLFRMDPTKYSDFRMTWSFICQLTENGRITENVGFARGYKYYVMFSTFFLPITKIFGVKSVIIPSIYLCILFTACSVLLFDTINYHYGKNYAFAAVMAWILIPVGMLEPLILVHENAYVILHIIVIWIFFRLVPSTDSKLLKAVYILLIAMILAYASKLNRFALISMIAIIIIVILNSLKNNNWLISAIKAVAVLLVFASMISAFNMVQDKIFENYVEPRQSSSASGYSVLNGYGWPIFVGSNYDTYGTWSQEDYDEYYKYLEFDNKEDAIKYQKDLISKRLNEYKTHPARIPLHVIHKFENISYDFNPLYYQIGNSVNDFLINGMNGMIYKLMAGVFMLISVVISFLVVLSYKRKMKEDSSLMNYFKLFMLGCCLILLFVEVMAKYSSHLLFVYLSIAVLNYNNISSNIFSIRKKLLKPFKKQINN